MASNAQANLRSCVKEFSLDQIEGTNNHRWWTNWIENLEYCFAFEGIEYEDKKKAALLALGGQALRELYKTLCEDTGSVTNKNAKKTQIISKVSKILQQNVASFSVQNLFQIKKVMTIGWLGWKLKEGSVILIKWI